MDEILAYLKANPTYFLATVDAEGNPQVRPFGTAALFEGKIYIQTGRKKAVSAEMLAYPRIAICDMGKGGTWLRIEADAVEDDRVEAQQAVLNDYPGLQKMYAAGDGNTQVFYLKNAKATISSFTAEPKTFEF